jgi:hypothetical protein
MTFAVEATLLNNQKIYLFIFHFFFFLSLISREEAEGYHEKVSTKPT